MNWMLDAEIGERPRCIDHAQKLLLMGSCFTEHIGGRLAAQKFGVLQNPHGILFDPLAVSHALETYIDNDGKADLFQLNGLWHSWRHHSRFSNPDKDLARQAIADSIGVGHRHLGSAQWLIVTLGSAFHYRLTSAADGPEGLAVANCHRAPAAWFDRRLSTIEEMLASLDRTLYRLWQFNPQLRILFTVSPVRHVRDGVIENNRSKGRLLEVVHHLAQKFDRIHYFPAYELVIDVLRDYRFYAEDLVHPNHAATTFVYDKFAEAWFTKEAQALNGEIDKLVRAAAHRPMHPATAGHQAFVRTHLQKISQLKIENPGLDFSVEEKALEIQLLPA